MLIVYSSQNEVIITTEEKEAVVLKDFFADKSDRDLDEYDRDVYPTYVTFLSNIALDWSE